MTVYLDSNVFIFAVLYNDERAEKARTILRKISLGELKAVTASLTIDEVVWKVLREKRDRDLAIRAGLKILDFENIEIMDVGGRTLRIALKFMEVYPTLHPRDAIHLATALVAGVQTIVSDDADFDPIKEIKRKPLN